MVITPPNSKNFGPKTHVHLQIIGKLMDVHSFMCTNRHRLGCTTGWFCSKRCLITTEYKHIPSIMLLLCQFRGTFFQSFQKPKSQEISSIISSCFYPTISNLTGWWFGTFFIFHFICIWDNPSHWLIFFKMVKATNQKFNISMIASIIVIYPLFHRIWLRSWWIEPCKIPCLSCFSRGYTTKFIRDYHSPEQVYCIPYTVYPLFSGNPTVCHRKVKCLNM